MRFRGTVELLLLGLQLACAASMYAQAGPPYQTDDPDPVPLHHFEAYAFSLSDTSRAVGTAWIGPASFEMNYGAAPRLQLHLVIPYVLNFPPNGAMVHGIGDIELGAKYKLVDESKYFPEAGVFPFIELPTGDASKDLGVGKTWYRLPLWLKKDFKDDKWTVYAGGGETIVPQEGLLNFPFAGALLQHKFGDKLVLGAELFGHGEQSSDASAPERALLADYGGYYAFTEHFQLLFAAGHSVAWAPETYTYLAAYWTWGKGPADASKPKGGEGMFQALSHR